MLIAFDTETTGLDLTHGCRPFMVTACDEYGESYVWQWEVDPFKRKPKYDPDDLYEIRQLVMDNTVVWHNILFDIGMLIQIGCLDDDYLDTCQYEDTLIMSHLFDNLERHGLKQLSKKYLAIKDDDEKALKDAVKAARREAKKLGMRYAIEGEPTMPAHKSGFVGADYWLPRAVALHQGYDDDHPWLTVCETYGTDDAFRTIVLYKMLAPAIRELGRQPHYEARRGVLPVVWRMKARGVTILPERMETLREEYLEASESYEKQAQQILAENGWGPAALKVNVNSHDQMREILFHSDGFALKPAHFTKRSQPAVHAQALQEAMESPENEGPVRDFILAVLLHRKHEKAAGDVASYIKFAKGDKLYYNLNLTGTSTTRFSSSYPNTQNISKGENPLQEFLERPLTMRYVFGPRPGRKWFAIDYRQLQLFIFAYITDERKLIAALEDGADAHDYVARQIFQTPDDQEPGKGQRRIAKNVNFGFIFGASPRKIEATAGRKGLWDIVIKLFPNAHAYITEIIDVIKHGGDDQKHKDGTIYLPFTFSDDHPGYPLRVPQEAPYSGVNYQVQGLEGLIVQRAMVMVDDYIRNECPDAFITLMIHDELVIDCPEDIDDKHIHNIQNLMVKAGDHFNMKLQTSCDLITDNLGEGTTWPIQAVTETG